MRHPIADIRPTGEETYEVSGLAIDGLSRRRLWLFDLEATGLDVARERVTQIAGVALEGRRIVEDEAFVSFVDPGEGVEIPAEVQALTGITREKLAGAPVFPDAWRACAEAARGASLWIGQSVYEFDVPLLEAELARHGCPPALPPILDSVVLATFLLGVPAHRWSTRALIERFGVDIDGLRRHDALDDVKILGRILLPMIEMVRREHGDVVAIPADRPLAIRRHPPITTASGSG
jgi:DNA polymerase III epsilon subunit-like protein